MTTPLSERGKQQTAQIADRTNVRTARRQIRVAKAASRPHLDSVMVFCPVKRFATEDIFSARVSNIIPNGVPRLDRLAVALPAPLVAVAPAKAEPPTKHEGPCFPPTAGAAVWTPVAAPKLGVPRGTNAAVS